MKTRRTFLTHALASMAVLGSTRALAETPINTPVVAEPPKDKTRPTHDTKIVADFVAAAHRDLEKVKSMVANDPKLVLGSVDTGNAGIGDWETGLNGAAHMGRRDIVEFLLSKGARIDTFCAAMLGYREAVVGLLKVEPRAATVTGPHRLTLLYHAAISGDVLIAEAIKPHLAPAAADFNQALSAAAREGKLQMTEWLLANGVSNVNAPDAFRKTPLKIALDKGYADLVEVLRRHGGKEAL